MLLEIGRDGLTTNRGGAGACRVDVVFHGDWLAHLMKRRNGAQLGVSRFRLNPLEKSEKIFDRSGLLKFSNLNICKKISASLADRFGII